MTHVQPFHTYHEYLQGKKLVEILSERKAILKLSPNDEKELQHLRERLWETCKMPFCERYNTHFN